MTNTYKFGSKLNEGKNGTTIIENFLVKKDYIKKVINHENNLEIQKTTGCDLEVHRVANS